MPIDKEKGEALPGHGLDDVWRVVPPEKYMNMPQLTTLVEIQAGNKFKTKKVVERPIWEVAVNLAQKAFADAGAEHLDFDVSVQEYPRIGRLAFIFAAMVKGREKIVVLPLHLTNEQIADLTVRKLWIGYSDKMPMQPRIH